MKQEDFQKNIRKVNHRVNAYYEQSSSQYGCIVLHEHLGLVPNIINVSKYLIGQHFTLMIPDLFAANIQNTLLNNQMDAIQKLQYSHVEQVIRDCYDYLKGKCKQIILIGFSVGSAYGLKIIERIKQFSHAYLFYGLPTPDSINLSEIKTKCTLFYGTQDKIKYLSDPRMYDHMKDKCKNHEFIKFQTINGVGHGFMNPESANFSETTVKQCKAIIMENMPKEIVFGDQKDKGKDDCRIF